MANLAITTPTEAVIRLMAEIVLFTDRPDYNRPTSVRDAFDILLKEYKVEMSYIYQHYGDWCEADDEASESDE